MTNEEFEKLKAKNHAKRLKVAMKGRKSNWSDVVAKEKKPTPKKYDPWRDS